MRERERERSRLEASLHTIGIIAQQVASVLRLRVFPALAFRSEEPVVEDPLASCCNNTKVYSIEREE